MAVAAAIVWSGSIAYVAYKCYLTTNETFLRYMTLAFLGESIIYSFHGLLTITANQFPILFILYGPASRAVFAIFLTAALLKYGTNVLDTAGRKYWKAWVALFVLILPAVAVLAFSPIGTNFYTRAVMEGFSIFMYLIALGIIIYRKIDTPLMGLYAVSLVLFAESSLAFILVKSAWSQMFWLAHLIFVAGFFVISAGLIKARRQSSSFANVFSEELLYSRLNEQVSLLETENHARKKTEAALEMAMAKVEAANLAKSNFLSTMSHEIRTPLNGVLGLAQLLKDTNLDEDQESKVNAILSSGRTLLAIINDVLDISKIEAGAIELESSPFSLASLVSTITKPFQSLADDKGLRLIVKEEGVSNRVVKGDPVRLRQILWNLLSNAIKFTEDGSVTLTIADADKAPDPNVDTKTYGFHFAVADTGTGIAPDRIDAIFDAFTQEDSTITRKHGGTGLGLSIVKKLTDLMGGTINVVSQIGEGTVFTVYLPFDAATKDEADAISLRKDYNNSQKAESLNVLIAEDNEINALIARSFLEKFGHNVQHAENGKIAVEAAKEGWADLILMDVHMPEMNGIDATKAIRLTKLGKNLPIIALTAEAFAERHVLFKEAGMNGVLTKPFTEQQLADTLAAHRLVERRSERRSEKPNDTSAVNHENSAPIDVSDLKESDVPK